MTEQELARVFKALGAPSRLRILKLIRDRKLCVNAITQQLDISQSAVSQHLAVLKEAGLVISDRYGSIVHYELNRKRFAECNLSMDKLVGGNRET